MRSKMASWRPPMLFSTEPAAVAGNKPARRQQSSSRAFASRWGRSLSTNQWIEAAAADRTDRQVSQLISLGGVALILGQASSIVAYVGSFTLEWNVLGAILMVQIVAFAAFGSVLPMRLLRVGWIAAPILGAALWLSAYAVYTGPQPVDGTPWPWAFEAALVSYLVLVVRPAWAAAATVGAALLPLLSAVIFLGEVPQIVVTATPIHLANLIYIALFTGIRARLNQLRDAEAHTLVADAQRVRAQVSARDQEELARLIHDEVLSVLVAATRFRGIPPKVLRTNASHALELLHRPSLDQKSRPLETGLAAERVVAALRRIDPAVEIDQSVGPGEVPGSVVDAVGAAAAEALRNCLLHAAAAPRRVDVSVSPAWIEVGVADEGPGFDRDQLDSRQLGIRSSIVARMEALPGGAARVDSAPGQGTKVSVTWRI